MKPNPIALGVLGTLAGVILIGIALAWMMIVFPDTDTTPVDPEARPPAEILESVRERDRATLTTYGWVDEANGVVRLPIAEAMRKLIEERRD